MKIIVFMIMVIALIGSAAVAADTIYSWKDVNGIQRFSSDPPPEGIKDFHKIESQASPPADRHPSNQRRSSYDEMVQQASQEADQLEQQREAEAAALAAEKKRTADARQKEATSAARQRLQEQLDALSNRAVSPTFSQGMKNAQMDQIKKEMERLENNPEAIKAQEAQAAPSSSSSGY
jgi:Domain of unknown function (DUF4124)